MGERKKGALRLDFDREMKLEFHGAKVTSDAGLLAYRELDEVFGLTQMGASLLADARSGKNVQHTMLALLRQGVFGRLGGYEDTNDSDSSLHWPTTWGTSSGGWRCRNPSSTGR